MNLRTLFSAGCGLLAFAVVQAAPVTFVFTSDVHFGIARSYFRGGVNVDSAVVNTTLVKTVNTLPGVAIPADGGLRAGEKIGPVDFVMITGDIANREELLPLKIQSATESWAQFQSIWIDGLKLHDPHGQPVPLLLVPGNHDTSNAVGSPSKLVPDHDATSMAEIYNRMVHPATPRTKDTFRFDTDRIYYSRDFGGAHEVVLAVWPDRDARAWLEEDLKHVPADEPVFIFCHDQPEAETRHFTNPNGKHDVNSKDKFENVIPEIYADGTTTDDGEPVIEQRAFVAFLKAHPNIVGYFHGNSNWTQFYTWDGPDHDIALNCFRSDSPMKGKIGAKDETKLAFNLIVYDTATKKLTARECLWNPAGTKPGETPLAWGISETVSIAPRK